MKRNLTLALTIICLCFTVPASVWAQSRLESSSYAIIDATTDAAGGSGDSANYSLLTSLNPLSDARLTSGSYALGSGFPSGIQANVPLVRCLETLTDDIGGGATDTSCTDPALTAATGGSDSIVGNGMLGVCGDPGCYDRAKVEVDPQNNPVDTVYLVSLSNDNFTNNIYYLKSDKSFTTSLTFAHYMTICQLQGYDSRTTTCDDNADLSWSQSQQEYNIIGLGSNQTWYVKVRALSGDFTETQYSAIASTTTDEPSITFDLDVAATDIETGGPYQINLGSLNSTTTTATNYIWTDLGSNAFNGVTLSINDLNAGLQSTTYTINSETEDLATPDGDGGFGVQATSVNEDALGPLQRAAAFNLASDNVRGLSPTPQTLFYTNTTGSNRGPVSGGRGQLTLKSRADGGVHVGSYSDILTFTASANW